MTRRRRIVVPILLVLVAIAAALLLLSKYGLSVTRLSLEFENLPRGFDGFKIVQLSDLHGSEFGQDNARAKPSSLVADFSKIPETVEAALRGEQIQPLLLR